MASNGLKGHLWRHIRQSCLAYDAVACCSHSTPVGPHACPRDPTVDPRCLSLSYLQAPRVLIGCAMARKFPPGIQVFSSHLHYSVSRVQGPLLQVQVYTGAFGSVVVSMRSSLSAAAGPTTRLPVPLPALTRVAIMSSFCFFDLGAACADHQHHQTESMRFAASQGRRK